MKITYLGHSCFVLTSDGGARILTDPYGDVGFCMPQVEADIVTVSHRHYDHNNVRAVRGNPIVIEELGKFNFQEFMIETFPAFHDDVLGAKRGTVRMTRMTIDGITVCHLGDIGEPYLFDRMQTILPVDVLLLPVGGNYTIDAEEAKAYADGMCPKIVIPMHYKTAGLNIDIAGVEDFLKYYEGNIIRCGCQLELTREDLTGEEIKIIVMERKV